MRIIVVGANGTIGKKVAEAFDASDDVVRVGRTTGDVLADYTDAGSVQEMFDHLGTFDALVATVGGDSIFKPYDELVDDDLRHGFERKVIAQLRLVRLGTAYAASGGSFTLSSGFLSHYPNPWSVATGPLNAAVDAAARAIAPLLPNDLRINVVSAAPVVPAGQEGRGRVTAEAVAQAYVLSVRGTESGQVIRAWGGLD